MNIKKQAFTLVELIVVITILAILGTIAFLSLSGYSKDSRNSVRFNDLKLIESSLELYSQKTGFYPESTLPVTITYANAEARKQGTFGEDTFGSVGKLDHLPLDPLTGTEYTYSLLNTKGEYELAAALEGIVASNDIKLINKTYAGTLEGTSLVLGTYNGYMLSVNTGGLDYVLAVPTIISGDITLLSVDEIAFYGKLAYNGSNVLAGKYKGTEFNTNKTFDYTLTANELMIFTGSIDDLKTNESERVKLLDNLQKAYNGTVLENNTDYNSIIGEDINITTPTDNTKKLSKTIIENSLRIDINTITTNITPSIVYKICEDLTISQYMCPEAKGNLRLSFSSGSVAGGTSVVYDSVTGLTWQSNGTVSGARTWDNAKIYCANLDLGGEQDWRLPDHTELQTILDLTASSPTIDTNYFTVYSFTPKYYRTSTSWKFATDHAYEVDFNNGTTNATMKIIGNAQVRCVR